MPIGRPLLDWPVPVTPLAPIACGSVVWRQGSAFGATIVVKATLALVPDANARLVAPGEILREDRYRGHTSSLEDASEVAPYLPNAGIVVHASARAPEGRPAPSLAARVALFREAPLVDKSLWVYGHRREAPGSPHPFDAIPIVYERAFGGPGIEDNPVGTGAAPGSPLPNVIDPQRAQRPTGFGPISRHWRPRRHLLGAVNPSVLDQPMAEIPPGFPWAFFQAAPADQQTAFLRGDEWILFEGLLAALPRFRTRLPDVRAHARWHLAGAAGPGPSRALDLSADTLVIRPDAGTCSLIWRGHVMLDQADIARMRVDAGVEMAGHPLAVPESEDPLNRTEMIRVDARALPVLPFGERPAPPPRLVPPAPLPGAPWSPEPAAAPPRPSEAFGTLEVASPFAAPIPEEPAPPEPPPIPAGDAPSDVRARVQAKLAEGASLDGEDLSGADLSGLDFTGRSMARCKGRGAKLVGAVLAGARLEGADFTAADFRDANLREARAEKAMFEGASFARADLGQASFRRAHLASACLAHARLEGTDFRHANLERANVHGTDRASCKLLGASTKGLDENAPRDEGPRPR